MEKNMTPLIRFRGFSEPWATNELSDISTINPKTEVPDTFEYVDLESVVGTSLLGHRTENKETAPSRAQRLASKGDIFYQTVRPYQKNNFLFDMEDRNYVFSTGYAQIRADISSHFLFNVLQREPFLKEVLNNCTGTSFPAINANALGRIDVSYPNDITEQHKIGDTLTNLDSVLNFKSKELEKLVNLKTACMEKMFPQQGETKPQLRFKGFNDEWNEVKLSDICSIQKGEQLNKSVLSETGDYYVLNGGITPSGYTNSYNTEANTISISEGGNSCGYVNFNEEPFWSGGHNYTLTNLKNIDVLFLYQFLKCYEASIMAMRVGSGLPNIQKTRLMTFRIVFPSIAEQKKIGNYFCHLDELIAAKRQEIEKLQDIKQSLLDKMFV